MKIIKYMFAAIAFLTIAMFGAALVLYLVYLMLLLCVFNQRAFYAVVISLFSGTIIYLIIWVVERIKSRT